MPPTLTGKRDLIRVAILSVVAVVVGLAAISHQSL
jgi:hypothetical protein